MTRNKEQINLKQWLSVLEEFLTNSTINKHYVEVVQWYGEGYSVADAILRIRKDYPDFERIEIDGPTIA